MQVPLNHKSTPKTKFVLYIRGGIVMSKIISIIILFAIVLLSITNSLYVEWYEMVIFCLNSLFNNHD